MQNAEYLKTGKSTCFKKTFYPTYNSEIDPRRPCLRHLKIDPAPVDAVVRLADVEHLEPGLLGAGTGIEDDPVPAQKIRLHRVSLAWTHVEPRPRVDRVDRRLYVLAVPHDKDELVVAGVGRHGDVAGEEGGVAGLVHQGVVDHRLGLA